MRLVPKTNYVSILEEDQDLSPGPVADDVDLSSSDDDLDTSEDVDEAVDTSEDVDEDVDTSEDVGKAEDAAEGAANRAGDLSDLDD